MSPQPLKVAVIGAAGQLGHDLMTVLSGHGQYRVSGFDRAALDVSDAAAVDRVIGEGSYEAVINCAALTNVDACEEQGEAATAVNAGGAYAVARACRRSGAKNVLIGTDFVFDGAKERPYLESDTPTPINIYGASKLSGEMLAAIAAPDTLVLRISSVFGKAGSRGKGGNFVEAILARARSGQPLEVVDDIVMSPTYTVDVAKSIPALLEADAAGIVHLANAGSCSWFEFARQIVQRANLAVPLNRISSANYPRAARRPANSALLSERLTGLIGRGMRSWQEALEEYLFEQGHLSGTAEQPRSESEDRQ